MQIEITSAEPVLEKQISKHQFIYKVTHWVVSGYTWDGVCMCSKKEFFNKSVDLGDTIAVSKLMIIHTLHKINKVHEIF